MTEIWKPVVGVLMYHYDVSNFGSIRRSVGGHGTQAGKILRMATLKRRGGYLVASLWKDGVPRMYRVHRLVAEAFIGPIPEGYEVNHIDKNTANNVLANLEIVTPEQNRAGITRRCGEDHPNSVLKETDAIEILRDYKRGVVTYRHLGARLGFRWEYVRDVVKGRTWKHLRPENIG